MYLVISPGFDKCKFGMWRSTYDQLYNRYKTVYGAPSIIATTVGNARRTEAVLKARFGDYGLLAVNNRELVWATVKTLNIFLALAKEFGNGVTGSIDGAALLALKTIDRPAHGTC